jgi:hypothetical protein
MAMKKLIVLSAALALIFPLTSIDADAAKKLRGSDLTKAQRQEFLANAQKACRKKFGAPSRVYEIDWYRLKVWCSSN